ncbi:rifin PIR protein, putative [Plasmodium reichenowi]|uniref:Rifin PIR protein, putative n=1 Tax=Plasmodium reichenowi TaxID=5854 RepID=A0A2P9DSK6_PLARE|nr:rifin PIR protein, putative [Plasmodium reichenowi]
MEHNKNKIYITSHTQTNRSLCECDTKSSIYDKDAEIKSVKETFDRQTSQRFKEYEERMQDKRQKRKEERDKNIEEIIKKDKMDKSLAEKVEKGFLRCGCGLGGVAASVGIFGSVAVKELAKTATAAAEIAAKETAMIEGAAAGEAAGVQALIKGLEDMGVLTLDKKALVSYFATTDYTKASLISSAIIKEYQPASCLPPFSGYNKSICTWVWQKSVASLKSPGMIQGNAVSDNAVIRGTVENIVSNAKTLAQTAAQQATDEVIQNSIAVVQAKYASCQTAIITSVVALLIIVLVMIIIYLVLRYRRKKKMKKKDQYTKLLNQ